MTSAKAAQGALQLVLEDANGTEQGVSVRHLGPALSVALQARDDLAELLPRLLRVTVSSGGAVVPEDLPSIFGQYELLSEGLRFVPHFPFDQGVSYLARFDAAALGLPDAPAPIELSFSMPTVSGAYPEVESFFPSSDELPDNLLRFYVKFAGPMQRGKVDSEVRVVDGDGAEVADVLYRAPVELWDRSMRLLTILLDPGRLKRGVGPNRELGPPLEAGKEYSLVIGQGMRDLSGQALPMEFRKRFRATPAVRESVDIRSWRIEPPMTWTRDALLLSFPAPLDWGMLAHAITVFHSGLQVEGAVEIVNLEMGWRFTPSLPWAPGRYNVEIARTLEDVCGNDILAPFDRPIRFGSPVDSPLGSYSLSFQIY